MKRPPRTRPGVLNFLMGWFKALRWQRLPEMERCDHPVRSATRRISQVNLCWSCMPSPITWQIGRSHFAAAGLPVGYMLCTSRRDPIPRNVSGVEVRDG